MKYSTVKISPSKNKWVVDVVRLPNDYIDDREQKPNSLGFFHFSEKITDEDAFEQLRNLMISMHQDEVDRLQKSIKKLKQLKLKKEK